MMEELFYLSPNWYTNGVPKDTEKPKRGLLVYWGKLPLMGYNNLLILGATVSVQLVRLTYRFQYTLG